MILELTEQEMQILISLLDAGVKTIGIQSVPAASVILAKIDEANKKKDNACE